MIFSRMKGCQFLESDSLHAFSNYLVKVARKSSCGPQFAGRVRSVEESRSMRNRRSRVVFLDSLGIRLVLIATAVVGVRAMICG